MLTRGQTLGVRFGVRFDHARGGELMTRAAVIEDVEILNDSYSRWLTEYDPLIQIDQLFDRAAAAQAIASKQYDLILMDLHLKADVHGGIGLMANVAKHQHCPVVIITGLEPCRYKDIMLELQAFEFLAKPVDQQDFTTVVRNALRASRERCQPTPTVSGELPIDLVINPLEKRY